VRRKLLWQLFPTYLLIALVTLLGLSAYANYSMRAFYMRDAEKQLASKAVLIGADAEAMLLNADETRADEFSKRLGKAAGVRITIIRADGRVIGDTDNLPAQMENHLERPEVQDALTHGNGTAIRYSTTERVEFMYYTLRIPQEGDKPPLGFLRISMPLHSIQAAIADLQHKVLIAALFALLLAAAASLLVSHRIGARLAQMKEGARRFASGELDFRMQVSPVEEFGGLADALNSMALQLSGLLEQVTRRRNELDAVLEAMVEGVLAVSSDYEIMFVNDAAAGMLGITATQAQGKDISDVVRIPELLRLSQRALEGYENESAEVILRSEGGGERITACVTSRLLGMDGRQLGAIVVMRDVTRERKLEQVRSDFVANVSHELRTPITAIKGFAESLLDGVADPEEAKRFLGIIVKNSDRLNSIIESLLALSRIELQAGEVRARLSDALICPILEQAALAFAEPAREAGITLHVECQEGLLAAVNAPLLEQALLNLISNAVKYSEAGGVVLVSARKAGASLEVSVADKGMGIAPEHHERIFERFYRVDKGRDRRLGGAGLGLAIVKHIALAHGGTVSLQSEPGKGSVFTLTIPAPPDAA
jgi:two-component system, OmpR family, phosphate regulon sensor histidine kinase PhoR